MRRRAYNVRLLPNPFRSLAFAALCAAAGVAQVDLVSAGYQHFYNLRYEQALGAFTAYAAQAPADPNAFNHIAHAILYRDMLHAGALETELVTGNNPFLRRPKVNASPDDQRRFDQNIGHAVELAQARLKRNSRDTGALYSLGVSYGLRANYNFLVRQAWRDSLRDATLARRAHSRILEIDPSFVDARMVPGMHDYIIGSLPLPWRLLGFLMGFRGGREEGIRAVELVAKKGRTNNVDAEFVLCAIYRRERNPKLAVPLVQDLMRRFPDNYLLPMELAQMYSDTGDKKSALAALALLRARKTSGAPSLAALRLEKICFAEGTIQFWYNDLEPALANMKQTAAAAGELDLNTGVLAWMRLGQIHDLRGERPQALEAYHQAIRYAPDSDAAREARQYLTTPYRRKRSGGG